MSPLVVRTFRSVAPPPTVSVRLRAPPAVLGGPAPRALMLPVNVVASICTEAPGSIWSTTPPLRLGHADKGAQAEQNPSRDGVAGAPGHDARDQEGRRQ